MHILTNKPSCSSKNTSSSNPDPPYLLDIVEEEEGKIDEEFLAIYKNEELRSSSDILQTFHQCDLVRDLGLSTDDAILLVSRQQEKDVLSRGTTFIWYKHREEEFVKFFSEEDSLVICNNILELMNYNYNPDKWSL